jgi:hypothetical protein
MGTIRAMPDELSVDVFTELGRLTWAAIKLEGYVEGLCSYCAESTRARTMPTLLHVLGKNDAERCAKGSHWL